MHYLKAFFVKATAKSRLLKPFQVWTTSNFRKLHCIYRLALPRLVFIIREQLVSFMEFLSYLTDEISFSARAAVV